MSNLQFFNFEGNEVRGILINDEPCFVGTDVANILGYADSTRAINQHVDKEDRKSLSYKASGDLIPSLWKKKNDFSNKVLITESGVYSLIFGSQQPNAKRFKRWVTSEVLPAIRKYGAYMTDQKAFNVVNNKDELKEKDIKIEEVEAKNKNLTIQLEESNKKADYLDIILGTPDALAISQIAADYGYGAVSFNRLLHKVGIQHRVNGQWILYRAYMGKNYVTTKPFVYKDHKGNDRTSLSTYWTQAGRKLIYDVLKDNDILPLIERDDIA